MGCGCGGGGRRNFTRRAPVNPRKTRKRGARTATELQALTKAMNKKSKTGIKDRRLIERKKRLAIARRILGR